LRNVCRDVCGGKGSGAERDAMCHCHSL
jgi:hypothetical protein